MLTSNFLHITLSLRNARLLKEKYTVMTERKGPRRMPRGVLATKPVYVRLMPAERKALESISAIEKRSMSCVARQMLVTGLGVLAEVPRCES
jgi:hypothetical protein